MIHAKRGEYISAEWNCKNAYNLFQEIPNNRGIGLASIALGHIIWRRVSEDAYDVISREHDFQMAEKYLNEADMIFTSIVHEPLRKWETLSEFGFLYSKWSLCSYKKREKSNYFKKSLERHTQALVMAKESLSQAQVIDSIYNIALTHMGHFQIIEAREWISKGIETIEPEFRIHSYRVDDSPTQTKGNIRWLMSGKLYSLQASIKLKNHDIQENVNPNNKTSSWLHDLAFSLFSFFQYSPCILPFVDATSHLLKEIQYDDNSKTILLSLLASLGVPPDYYVQYVDRIYPINLEEF